MTELRIALRAATARLAEAGIETPRVDAELLAAYTLGVGRSHLLLIDILQPDAAADFGKLVDRRAAREPLQHIVGEAPFLGRLLSVGPGVFVPRPETELLAAWGIEVIGLLTRPVAVDLCSGSGALAVAIADANEAAHVYAVERSPAALPWLRRNTEGTAVTVVEGDVTDPAVLHQLDGSVDLVVCNPPYVPAAVGVPAEVSHDPAEAVFAGPDGLDVIPAIISRAASLCRDGGHLGLEHDESQAKVVAELLRDDGRYAEIEGMSDLAGRPRFTIARRVGWRESLPTRDMAG